VTEPPTGEGLVGRRVRVADRDVVWLRSVLEGYEGLALLYGDRTGVVTLVAPLERAEELDALLLDLAAESSLALL